MDHADHVALLRGGLPTPRSPSTADGNVTWADLGSGTGAFTLALAELLGADGEIYSIDRDAGALRQQERTMHERFPSARVHTIRADLARPLPDLPPLDGVVMANVLHFFREKGMLLGQVRHALKPGGRLIVVEYNVDRGNVWVPYPLSFSTWQTLAAQWGLIGTRLLATRPSRFLHEIYAALSVR